MFHVYHLVDPSTRTVRYIGTTTNPKRRISGHIAEAKLRQNTEKKAWIHYLLGTGSRPVLAVVQSVETEAEAREIESRECHKHLATIYNMHDPLKGAKDIRRGTKKTTSASSKKRTRCRPAKVPPSSAKPNTERC